MAKIQKPKPTDQVKAFRKAARELGADDNEDRFREALRKIAKSQKPRAGEKAPKTGDN